MSLSNMDTIPFRAPSLIAALGSNKFLTESSRVLLLQENRLQVLEISASTMCVVSALGIVLNNEVPPLVINLTSMYCPEIESP